MRIMVTRNSVELGGYPVETYSSSMVRVLREKGHDVVDIEKNVQHSYRAIDLLIDIDCGRNLAGELVWQAQEGPLPVKSAVVFIDSHGYPSLHKRLAVNYDHVFFAVYSKRDLFVKHPSAHWFPNFSDLRWFDGAKYPADEENGARHEFGFYGSKGGLSRADPLKAIAKEKCWTYDVRQISANGKHRWPQTAEAMANCAALFNRGQKHDSPNLRVMESMLMNRPLINDQDPASGMDKLFEPWVHYIPYEYFTYEGLEEAMRFTIHSRTGAEEIAQNAYDEVKSKHLVEHRIDQLLEVVA